MCPETEGPWVRYEDVAAILSEPEHQGDDPCPSWRVRLLQIAGSIDEKIGHPDGTDDARFLRNLASREHREEDWPEVVLARERPGNRPLIDSTGRKPPGWKRIETRRYIPATSQDSSGPCTGCSECELAQELIEAHEEVERAETALEELAEEFEAAAEKPEQELQDDVLTEVGTWAAKAEAKTNRENAASAREKAAELKEGNGGG